MLRKLMFITIAIGVMSSPVFFVQRASADLYGTCTVTSQTVTKTKDGEDRVITNFDCGGGYTRTCYMTFFDGGYSEWCRTYKDGVFYSDILY